MHVHERLMGCHLELKKTMSCSQLFFCLKTFLTSHINTNQTLITNTCPFYNHYETRDDTPKVIIYTS